jgi:hypothetical protein
VILKNQKGQFLIETILLMVITISLMGFIIKTLRERNVLANLVETPWNRTSGMIESGNWNDASTAKQLVPYNYNRFYTPDATGL